MAASVWRKGNHFPTTAALNFISDSCVLVHLRIFGQGQPAPVCIMNIRAVDSFAYLCLRSVSYSFTCVSVNLAPGSCSCCGCCEARLHGETAHRILAIVVSRTRKGGSMGVRHTTTSIFHSGPQEVVFYDRFSGVRSLTEFNCCLNVICCFTRFFFFLPSLCKTCWVILHLKKLMRSLSN